MKRASTGFGLPKALGGILTSMQPPLARPTVIALAVFISIFSVGSMYVFAQSGCHLMSESEAATARSAGNTAAKAGVQVCDSDQKIFTQDAAVAKEYILSIAEGLQGTKAPPDRAHIEKLYSPFAVCAANFFKAYSQRYSRLIVRSAYRDGPSGENQRAGGVPGSNHTRGIAIDVNPVNGDYPTLWNFARSNPQFGVCFPHLGTDRPHMILAGTGGNEAAKCASQGVVQACSGSGFDPSAIRPASGSISPTSALSEQIRRAISTPPPPPPPQLPTQQQPISQQQQQPLQSAYQTPDQQTLTQTGTQQPVSQTPISGLLTPTSINANTNLSFNGTTSTSTVDLLEAFSNPFTMAATEIGTSSPISLILASIQDVATLSATSTATSTLSASSSALSQQPVNAAQTFTSPDLGGGISLGPLQISTFQQILESAKKILLGMLEILKPFGGFDNLHSE